jgi:predicted PurR-regulated permease PerM
MIAAILGSLGGVVAFIAAISVVVRSIARQVQATVDNTRALKDLKDTVLKLDATVDGHTLRIQRVEDVLDARKRD